VGAQLGRRVRPMSMHERVVQANLAWYARESANYDRFRSSDTFLNEYATSFAADYDRMRLSPGAPVLDACAGSGLLTRLFLDRGHPVTAVDVSPDMLALVDDRAVKVEAEISVYLQSSRRFDCIALGSALHHLWDYESVVRAAADRLADEGVIYIVAEPIAHSGAGRVVREAEFVWRKLRRNPGDVIPAVRRRLMFSAASAEPTGELVGLYAEVHAHGIRLEAVEAAVEPRFLRIWRTGPWWIRVLKRGCPGYRGDNFTMIASKRARRAAAASQSFVSVS
jgi:SAM-dependent methyltransferase